MNIQDLFVPYETAKALKEKGFYREFNANGSVGSYYDYLGDNKFNQPFVIGFYDSLKENQFEWTTHAHLIDKDLLVRYTIAPLYQQVIDWLDNMQIYITVDIWHREPRVLYFGYTIGNFETNLTHSGMKSANRNEVLLEAIKQALKLIK